MVVVMKKGTQIGLASKKCVFHGASPQTEVNIVPSQIQTDLGVFFGIRPPNLASVPPTLM